MTKQPLTHLIPNRSILKRARAYAVTSLLTLLAYSALALPASAASAPLSGYAWSENTGWIQFSCPQTLDGVQLKSIDVTGFAWSENIGWVKFGGPGYGVTIDTATGAFQGNAWSENIGYVSFERASAGDPPGPPYNDGASAIARYDKATGLVTGWVRALSNGSGWDGWIKLRDDAKGYGLTIDKFGLFTGYAWGGDVVGWLKFDARTTQCGQSYGVTFDTNTGQFSGFAWAESVGWFNFNPAGPYPALAGAASQAAKLNFGSDKIEGWAQLQSAIDAPVPSGKLNGFLWSENIGWIQTAGINQAGQPYGVKIDLNSGPNNGAVSGDAWSETLGWLSFNKTETGTPPAAPYNGASDTVIAKYDPATGNFSGWGRALNSLNTPPSPPNPAPPPPNPTSPTLAPSYPITGFAWSENIGWLELNNPSLNYGVYIDAATNKLTGRAWSENIGWVSFDRSETGDPPAAPFFGSGATVLATYDPATGAVTGWARALTNGDTWDGWIKLNGATYGVIIDKTVGTVSGFAWGGDVIGWLEFNNALCSACRQGGAPVTTTQTPPFWANGPWDGWVKLSGAGYGAQANLSTGALSGYAWGGDVLGWIEFNPPISGTLASGTAITSADIIPASSADAGWLALNSNWNGVSVNRNTCELEGYAWGGNPVGWVSFNCKNNNSCGASNYHATVGYPGCTITPTALNPTLTASASVFCQAVPTFTFSWLYDSPNRLFGDSQSAYQIQIDNDADFSSPEFDTGKVLAAASTITKGIADATLAWGAVNRWRVKVWNSNDKPSDWAVSADTINTPIHALPKAAFDWSPKNILPNLSIEFTDQTVLSPATAGTTWAWTFTGGSPNPVTASTPNVKVKFASPYKTATAELKVSDNAGSCTLGKSLNTGLPLPKYREINPGTVLEPSF